MFTASSFASRKAEADRAEAARAVPRLASLGQTEFRQRTKDGDVEVLAAELFVDVDRPMERFLRFDPRGQLIAMFQTSGNGDRVTDLGPVPGRRLSRPDSSAHLPAPADPPPRPV